MKIVSHNYWNANNFSYLLKKTSFFVSAEAFSILSALKTISAEVFNILYSV